MENNYSDIKRELIRSVRFLVYGSVTVVALLIIMIIIWFFLFKSMPPKEYFTLIGASGIAIVLVGVIARLALRLF